MSKKELHIGFIGAGNMAKALVGGMIANGTAASTIHLSDINQTQLDNLQAEYGVNTTADNKLLIQNSDIIVLSVKPQVMQQVVEALSENFKVKKPLIISIAAGITTASLQNWVGDRVPIVRCMPNTPALLKLGASALFANKECSNLDKQNAQQILEAVGIVEWLASESEIDAVTALSGSGPAYYFLMMEAMIDAAVSLGLKEETARALCMQTALGAASMAQKSDVDITELRRRVTSPNGTTEAALNSFSDNKFSEIIKQAMEAANARSIELSKE